MQKPLYHILTPECHGVLAAPERLSVRHICSFADEATYLRFIDTANELGLDWLSCSADYRQPIAASRKMAAYIEAEAGIAWSYRNNKLAALSFYDTHHQRIEESGSGLKLTENAYVYWSEPTSNEAIFVQHYRESRKKNDYVPEYRLLEIAERDNVSQLLYHQVAPEVAAEIQALAKGYAAKRARRGYHPQARDCFDMVWPLIQYCVDADAVGVKLLHALDSADVAGLSTLAQLLAKSLPAAIDGVPVIEHILADNHYRKTFMRTTKARKPVKVLEALLLQSLAFRGQFEPLCPILFRVFGDDHRGRYVVSEDFREPEELDPQLPLVEHLCRSCDIVSLSVRSSCGVQKFWRNKKSGLLEEEVAVHAPTCAACGAASA